VNVIRFYETLAKIIGEREGVEIKVNVREVTENRTLSSPEDRIIPHENESEFLPIHGAGYGKNIDRAHEARRIG
jgi:hypothetical protein